ncbi:CIC11C00000004982 [Sungouiella intermedia]|uniref:CIC11C00000004982 n=1 Tax=Sungouiella intermedia TaxID=45354 RepID=A0A1L0C144_9ASCO|nr:CIC11C00000004982 [[Candida] intermedia]
MPINNVNKERMDQITNQMLHAGAIGFLKGTLIALVTGYYFNYRYNHGHNARFFLMPYKTWYLVSWGIVGITFSAEVAKLNITKELAEEEDLKRNQYFSQELGGK